jgi:hypothetical protein
MKPTAAATVADLLAEHAFDAPLRHPSETFKRPRKVGLTYDATQLAF